MDADANVNTNANAEAGGNTIALRELGSGELKRNVELSHFKQIIITNGLS